jgi:hypothetical protein
MIVIRKFGLLKMTLADILSPKFPKISLLRSQDKFLGVFGLSPESVHRMMKIQKQTTSYTSTEKDSGYEFKDAKNVRTGEYMWLSRNKGLRIEVKHVKCDIIGPFASAASFHCG